jgi:hypothetical protein
MVVIKTPIVPMLGVGFPAVSYGVPTLVLDFGTWHGDDRLPPPSFMESQPSPSLYLNFCRRHGNTRLGDWRRFATTGSYVVCSHIFVPLGMCRRRDDRRSASPFQCPVIWSPLPTLTLIPNVSVGTLAVGLPPYKRKA